MKGPLLIASNHPNSFLDAIIFDILFDIPLTSLARGDAFQNKFIFRVLRSLNMLPVYRISEGSKHLNINYNTFDACIKIFKQKEGVLIFSEGLCVNEWHLRTLKKGTARLAFKAWQEGEPVSVIPVGINYSSFNKLGKKVIVNFGNIITVDSFETVSTDGEKHLLFNRHLYNQLQLLVFEIAKNDKVAIAQKFGNTALLTKILVAVPAFVGVVLHAPLYAIAWLIAKTFFNKTDHHDSVMFGVLLLTYPFYLLLMVLLIRLFSFAEWWWVIGVLPFTALCFAKYEVRKN